MDRYEIVETEAEAKAIYENILTHESTYCAGYAQIKAGTEPHWTEGEEEWPIKSHTKPLREPYRARQPQKNGI